jgi:hypothetical protein
VSIQPAIQDHSISVTINQREIHHDICAKSGDMICMWMLLCRFLRVDAKAPIGLDEKTNNGLFSNSFAIALWDTTSMKDSLFWRTHALSGGGGGGAPAVSDG